MGIATTVAVGVVAVLVGVAAFFVVINNSDNPLELHLRFVEDNYDGVIQAYARGQPCALSENDSTCMSLRREVAAYEQAVRYAIKTEQKPKYEINEDEEATCIRALRFLPGLQQHCKTTKSPNYCMQTFHSLPAHWAMGALNSTRCQDICERFCEHSPHPEHAPDCLSGCTFTCSNPPSLETLNGDDFAAVYGDQSCQSCGVILAQLYASYLKHNHNEQKVTKDMKKTCDETTASKWQNVACKCTVDWFHGMLIENKFQHMFRDNTDDRLSAFFQDFCYALDLDKGCEVRDDDLQRGR